MADRDYKKELYESYKTDRKDLNDTALTISERYDKNILYVSGGALAVSLTFLEKIAPNPGGWLVVIVGISWACLVLSILAHLMALAYGQRAIRRQMELLDEDYSRFLHSDSPESEIAKEAEDTSNCFSKVTGILSQIALSLAVLGVALLCVFSVGSLRTKIAISHDQATKAIPAATTQTAAKGDQRVLHSAGELAPSTAASQKAVVKEAKK